MKTFVEPTLTQVVCAESPNAGIALVEWWARANPEWAVRTIDITVDEDTKERGWRYRAQFTAIGPSVIERKEE